MITTCLQLSVKHVSQETMKALMTLDAEGRHRAGWPLFTVAPHETGVFMTLPEFLTVQTLRDMPEDLHALLSCARIIGVTLLQLDQNADADTFPHLPTYDW